MTEDELLAPCLADPDDAGARVVYADWLEQRGDSRANVVRALAEVWRAPLEHPETTLAQFEELDFGRARRSAWFARLALPSNAEIRRRLDILAELDPMLDRELGADTHRYLLHPPATAEALAKAEADGPLPAQYRRFVTQLGDGGAGPRRGLRGLGDESELHAPPSRIRGARQLSGTDISIYWLFGDRVWQTIGQTAVPERLDAARLPTILHLPHPTPLEMQCEFLDWYVLWLERALGRLLR